MFSQLHRGVLRPEVPGVDDAHAAVFEVSSIPRGERGVVRTAYRRNHGIELRNRKAFGFPKCDDLRILASGCIVKR